MPFDNTNIPQDDGATTDVGAPPRSQVFPPVQPIDSDNRDQATEPVVSRTASPATKVWIRSPDERIIVENLDDLEGLTFTAPVPFADTQAALNERAMSERPMQMWAAPPHLSKSAYDLEHPRPWATPWTGGAFSLGIAVGIALGGLLFTQPPTPIPEIAVAPPVMLPHSLPVPHTAITVEPQEPVAAPTPAPPRAASPPRAAKPSPATPAKRVDEIAVAPTVPIGEIPVAAAERPAEPLTIGTLSSIPIAIPGGRAVGVLSEIPVANTVSLPASLALSPPAALTVTEEAPPPAAPTGPMISFGEMDLLDFSSGAASVNATLEAGKPGMESCYANAAAAGNHPKGHVKLTWIALNGQPRRVSVVNTNLDNTALIGCLIIRANRWRFSSGASGAGNVVINVGG